MPETKTNEIIEVTEKTVEAATEVAEQAVKAGLGTGTKVAIAVTAVTVVTCGVIAIVKKVKKNKKANEAEQATEADAVDESNFEETAE